MSHSPNSYIDGVPVKISERYKPPPKRKLPQKLAQALADCQRTQQRMDAVIHNFRAEQAAQAAAERQAALRRERHERRQRLHAATVQRQRAADEKQKQKLTAVSYPDTDELSSDDGDGDHGDSAPGGRPRDDVVERAVAAGPQPSIAAVQSRRSAPQTPSPTEASQSSAPLTPLTVTTSSTSQRFDTILVPTRASATSAQNVWAFADSTKATMRAMNAERIINYSDFETDTSSPFDNAELHAMNDLDVLAQVLNLDADVTTKSVEAAAAKRDQSSTPPSTTTANKLCDNQLEHSGPSPSPSPTLAAAVGGVEQMEQLDNKTTTTMTTETMTESTLAAATSPITIPTTTNTTPTTTHITNNFTALPPVHRLRAHGPPIPIIVDNQTLANSNHISSSLGSDGGGFAARSMGMGIAVTLPGSPLSRDSNINSNSYQPSNVNQTQTHPQAFYYPNGYQQQPQQPQQQQQHPPSQPHHQYANFGNQPHSAYGEQPPVHHHTGYQQSQQQQHHAYTQFAAPPPTSQHNGYNYDSVFGRSFSSTAAVVPVPMTTTASQTHTTAYHATPLIGSAALKTSSVPDIVRQSQAPMAVQNGGIIGHGSASAAAAGRGAPMGSARYF